MRDASLTEPFGNNSTAIRRRPNTVGIALVHRKSTNDERKSRPTTFRCRSVDNRNTRRRTDTD